MNRKTLNIQLIDNMSSTSSDNNLDPQEHTVAARGEDEAFANIIQINDYRIKEVEDKLSKLEIKLSAYSSSTKDKFDKLMEVASALINKPEKSKDDQIEKLQSILKSDENKSNEKDPLKETNVAQISVEESTIEKLNNNIAELSKKLEEYDRKLAEQWENKIRIYIPYGTSTKLMHVTGLEPFELSLDDTIAGPGWIVIQRRIEDIDQIECDLNAYHKGFGDLHSDFWLGLEKMHRITTHQQHELYINIVDFDDETFYAQYDNFVVGSKNEEYQLRELGRYQGDAGDMLRISEKKSFSVCPDSYIGWWYLEHDFPHCNLNGRISETFIKEKYYLYWGLGKWGNDFNNIKSAQMLIRPKYQD